MTKSLAAVFMGQSGVIELNRLATPKPQGREILVRILGCTLCGSDLHSFHGRRTVPVPTILGHEYVGEIVGFGKEAPHADIDGEPIALGDFITWAIVASCGDCFYCKRDLPQKCLRSVKYGHEAFTNGRELLGGLAEHCLLVPGTAIVKLPPSLPLEVGCPASCATATIAAALAAAGIIQGRTVCILGCGLLGLTACAFANSVGAEAILAVDVEASRRQRALSFGASEAIEPKLSAESIDRLTGGRGIDIAIELSGANAAFESVWPSLRIGGTMVLVGSVFPGSPVPISLEQIVRRNLTIRGVHNYAPHHLAQAVRFLCDARARYPFETLVNAWYPLEQVSEAFAQALRPDAIRIGVRPS